MTFSPAELREVAHRHYVDLSSQGGISPEACFVLAVAELAGEPLDVFLFDDAALVCRAERLVMDGLAASVALATAREERVTWAR